ncbi:peptide chain release factor N(5)-glutamine methyltransferase [Paenibacillus pasadenensis]|uniref:peptide chain release factor N(5)-glutamine methyltransferase n=1 Tax=Paenibacillus pasadenensis TaxID=217090 RepID=UPI00203F7724|nr:peptide chain release factor N(5)-glutamine methyltransferase [Paenibacillus pasadenensis]MCM3747620.1 peptide chain release factor N(5)-glutamine methyltransferase [Paenibacillus pasadenensis]
MDIGGQKSGEAYRPPAGLSLSEARRHAAAYLHERGVEEAEDNVSLLLQHVLGMSRAELMLGAREGFPADRAAAWSEAVSRKGRGEPAQYIAGEQWFYGRPFAVSPAVLIPRPETELLVEAVLKAADRLWPSAASSEDAAQQAGHAAGGGLEAVAFSSGHAAESAQVGGPADAPLVLDVGTGSGAIALTLAAERPRWRVYASDLSPAALAAARANAERLHAPVRAFAEGDLLAPFLAAGGGEYAGLELDILVSNPPYIPAGDLPGLQREVRDYEPLLALDGGADGLDPYRRMAEQLRELKRLPSIVAFELGIGQAAEVARLLEAFGHWNDISVVTDYGGIDRHVVAVRTGSGHA